MAAGDVDGDGLCDLYFCSIEGTNTLFRNLGQWRFEPVPATGGIGCPDMHSTGCVLVDVDGDGDLDLAPLGRGADRPGGSSVAELGRVLYLPKHLPLFSRRLGHHLQCLTLAGGSLLLGHAQHFIDLFGGRLLQRELQRALLLRSDVRDAEALDDLMTCRKLFLRKPFQFLNQIKRNVAALCSGQYLIHECMRV